MSSNKKKVFISYHHDEEKLAEIIQKTLERAINKQKEQGEVFRGEDSLYPGSQWMFEIQDNLYASNIVVVICSPTSLKRNWVAFECGFAAQGNIEIMAFCHSGVTCDDLPEWIPKKEDNIVHANSVDALGQLAKKVLKSLSNLSVGTIEVDPTCQNEINKYLSYRNTAKFDNDGKEENTGDQSYRNCKLNRQGNKITISFNDAKEVSSLVSRNKSEDPHVVSINSGDFNEALECWRVNKLIEMQKFLFKYSSADVHTGVAIGVQNCLYDEGRDEVCVGIRYKSNVDASATGISLGKGEFNTGYLLLRKKEHIERVKAADVLQDLFVANNAKYHLKPPDDGEIKKAGKVYDYVNSRLQLFGTQLFEVCFKDTDGDEISLGWGSLFINNSCWFPRFEIGIWKYMDIDRGDINDHARKRHFLPGFGEDLFQDYRGNVDNPASEINFWVWAKDGRIVYRSYPEERYIPRCKPQRRTRFKCHQILISSEALAEQYGIVDQYTPFVPDEIIRSAASNEFINVKPTQPAVRLLTWF